MIHKTCIILCLMLLAGPVFSVPFSNGDFSAGAASWVDASATGSASVVGGQAQLDTGLGSDPYSSVFVQGDDGFFSFGSPVSLDSSVNYLNFDVAFIDLGADTFETGNSSYSDFLRISLYDLIDPSWDIYIDPLVDIGLGSTMVTLQFDVSSLAGRDIALSFELSDENDGRNSRVLLDNITFTTGGVVSVSAPSVIYLMLIGLILMGCRNSKNIEFFLFLKKFGLMHLAADKRRVM